MSAPIGCLIDSARLASIFQTPRPAHTFVGRGVQRIWLTAIEHQVDRAGSVVEVEDLLPGGAAVSALEDAALFIGGEQMAHSGHVHYLWISRVNHYPGDMLRIL